MGRGRRGLARLGRDPGAICQAGRTARGRSSQGRRRGGNARRRGGEAGRGRVRGAVPASCHHGAEAPPILLKFGPLDKGIDRTLIDGAANLPYAIPNLLVDQVAVDLLPVPRGFWRSVGISQNAFVTECFFDEVAVAAGKDPYELRRQLLRDKPRHLRTLELAAQKAGGGTPL